jgi:hypothetical protein
MPSGSFTIDTYYVELDSNPAYVPASIMLCRESGTLGAVLEFYSPEHTMPENTVTSGFPSRGYAHVFYPISSFAAVLDVLRNEKPLIFLWDDAPHPNGSIRTRGEPVGEGEGT